MASPHNRLFQFKPVEPLHPTQSPEDGTVNQVCDTKTPLQDMPALDTESDSPLPDDALQTGSTGRSSTSGSSSSAAKRFVFLNVDGSIREGEEGTCDPDTGSQGWTRDASLAL